MGLVALTEGIFYGKPTGRSSERTTMAVVVQINDDADRWLAGFGRLWVVGRLLALSCRQPGALAPSRCATAA